MKFTADFETTTDPMDCRVWAVGICSIDNVEQFSYGNTIDYFYQFAELYPGSTFYFHNLKFDGEFFICDLFDKGYHWVNSKKELAPGKFTTLISDKGMFYALECMLKSGKTFKLIDSLKILPFSVDAVASGFGLPISKLKIDYDEYRTVGHVLTQQEVAYLRNDVEIMARALKILFDQGLRKMTQGSNALSDYKKIIGKQFKYWFPPPDYDSDIRQSYKGGFTYVNDKVKGKDVGFGIVLDVNSLYPWVMSECLLPYGEGKFYNGKYEDDIHYPLYVQMLTVNFTLKPDGIPTIQLKNVSRFQPTEYVRSSDGEEVTLCLTSVDLKLFFDNYDIHTIEYHSGWKFRAAIGMFKKYINKWYTIKVEADMSSNKAMRKLAKLMLNALYGKFATNPKVISKIPTYIDGSVHYVNGPEEWRTPIYIPMGTFITAYARDKTIRSAMVVKDRFLYADTDSLHLTGWDLPEGLDIDATRLGAWKIESKFVRARFIRAKSYIEDEVHTRRLTLKNKPSIKVSYNYTKLKIICAGMPASCHKHVHWDNFYVGSVFPGKLQQKRVRGGIVLQDTDFTLRP